MESVDGAYYGFFIERNDSSFILNLIKKDDLMKFKLIADPEFELDKEKLNSFSTPFLEISNEEPLVENLFKGPTLNLYSNSWIKLKIENDKNGKTILYNLSDQDENVTCSIKFFKKMKNTDDETETLIKTFSLTNVKESTVDEIQKNFSISMKDKLSNLFISIYDVGHGNCNAICMADGTPIVYFDVGRSCGPNSKYFPSHLQLCTCTSPPVILSHWHQDHYGSAKYNHNLLNFYWLTKLNTRNLSPDAYKYASYLSRKNLLLIYPSSISNIRISYGNIISCTGMTPNDSGLAFLSDIHNELSLFSGDAKYQHIPLNTAINNLVVSHHGGSNTTASPNSTINNSHFYSYALDNTYNHPNAKTVKLHSKKWSQRKNTVHGSIGLFTSKVNMNINHHSQTVCHNHSIIYQNVK